MIPLRDNLIPTLRYITREQFKRSENREKRCRWCGNARPKHKTRWCSKDCQSEYLIRIGGGGARGSVRVRDNGRCAACGMDCGMLERVAAKCEPRDRRFLFRSLGVSGTWFWEADHIVPVHQGGGQCGLDGLQTLCVWCHRDKSKIRKAVPK